MSEDDQALLAMWDGKMETTSIARMMRWSEARVVKRLDALREARRAELQPPAAVTMLGGDTPITGSNPWTEDPPAEAPDPKPQLVRFEPLPVQDPRPTIERGISGPLGEPMGRSAVFVAPERRDPKPAAFTRGQDLRVPARHVYNPVSPAKLRYAAWFRDARWSWREIGWLFNVEPEDLQEALGG